MGLAKIKSGPNILCRECGEVSPRGSLSCIGCGQLFGEASGTRYEEPAPELRAFGRRFDPLTVAVLVTACALFYLLTVILPLHPIHSPLTRLLILGIGLSVVSSLLVAIDSMSIEATGNNYEEEGRRALRWCVLVLLFWPVAFPLYMTSRTRDWPRQHRRAALWIIGVFVVAMLLTWAVQQIRRRATFSQPVPKGLVIIEGTPANLHGQPHMVMNRETSGTTTK